MNDSSKPALIKLTLTEQEGGLHHFAEKGASPAWMMGAHFIDKLPAILRNAAWIGVIAAIRYWA